MFLFLKETELRYKTNRYDALKIQVSLAKESYIIQNGVNPTIVSLQKEDADFAIEYNHILRIAGRLQESSLNRICDLEIEIGDKICARTDGCTRADFMKAWRRDTV